MATTPPNWTPDELILALDVYFRTGRKWLSDDHPEVIKLSALLNQLNIHDPVVRGNNFRNPAGVSMKLANFLPLDPEYQGTGLSRGAKLDKVIWDEFSGDPQRLSQVAAAIAATSTAPQGATSIGDDAEEEFAEGRVLTRLHKAKERNRKAVEQKKAQVLKQTGKLACEVCGFDFEAVYGELGKGFAECHHTIPLAHLSPNHKTQLKDLAIVCANCHRMLHRGSKLITLAELKSQVG